MLSHWMQNKFITDYIIQLNIKWMNQAEVVGWGMWQERGPKQSLSAFLFFVSFWEHLKITQSGGPGVMMCPINDHHFDLTPLFYDDDPITSVLAYDSLVGTHKWKFWVARPQRGISPGVIHTERHGAAMPRREVRAGAMIKYQSRDSPVSFQNILLRLQASGTKTPIWVLLGGGNKAGAHNMQTSGSVGEEKHTLWFKFCILMLCPRSN